MLKKDVIKKALMLNDMLESDNTVVTTEEHHYILYIFNLLVLSLYYFALANDISSAKIFNFIISNFKTILDSVTIEIEIAILVFDDIYEDEEKVDVIEFHNKDECLLFMSVQDRLNKQFINIMKGN